MSSVELTDRGTYRFSVYCDIDDDRDIREQLDEIHDRAVDAAGVSPGGSGCGGGVRDLEFHFAEEDTAIAARQRLIDAGFRAFHCGDCVLRDSN